MRHRSGWSGLGHHGGHALRQSWLDQYGACRLDRRRNEHGLNPQIKTAEHMVPRREFLPNGKRVCRAQPCRALKRGFFLLIRKTLPRRRTSLQFLSRVLADFRELRIFITTTLICARRVRLQPRERAGCTLSLWGMQPRRGPFAPDTLSGLRIGPAIGPDRDLWRPIILARNKITTSMEVRLRRGRPWKSDYSSLPNPVQMLDVREI